MTPKQVKDLALKASELCNTGMAIDVCHRIAEGDLFIGYPVKVGEDAKPITAKYPGRCQKTGRLINPGDQIIWEKGVGGILLDAA